MRKIAERIEYSPAAIYSYFPSKDDIFFALAEEGFRLLAQLCAAPSESVRDPLERLRRGLWAFYEFSKTHPGVFRADVHRSLGAQPQPGLPAVRVLPGDHRARGGGYSAPASSAGNSHAALNPAAALHVLWVGMLGAATIGLAQRLAPGEDPDALAHDLLESLLAGFTTRHPHDVRGIGLSVSRRSTSLSRVHTVHA